MVNFNMRKEGVFGWEYVTPIILTLRHWPTSRFTFSLLIKVFRLTVNAIAKAINNTVVVYRTGFEVMKDSVGTLTLEGQPERQH